MSYYLQISISSEICPGLTLIRCTRISISVMKCPHALLPNFNITHFSEYRQLMSQCPPNAASQVRINSSIYPKIKITLTFTLTLLLEVGSKGLDLKGHFVLDVKIRCASN